MSKRRFNPTNKATPMEDNTQDTGIDNGTEQEQLNENIGNEPGDTGDQNQGTGDEQGAGDEPTQDTGESAETQSAPETKIEEIAAAAPVTELVAPAEANDWPSLRAQALTASRNSEHVLLLIETLERFQQRLGHNARYGNPVYHEEGARYTQEMLRGLVRSMSLMDRGHVKLAYRLLVEFVRFNSNRYDAFYPAAVFRFQPAWPGSSEEANGFEVLVALLRTTAEDGFRACRELNLVGILSIFPVQARDLILELYAE